MLLRSRTVAWPNGAAPAPGHGICAAGGPAGRDHDDRQRQPCEWSPDHEQLREHREHPRAAS
jgi:hypothetical protein